MDETVAEMAMRVTRVCDEAVAECHGKSALVVSHADPIRAFWNRNTKRPDWRFHLLGLQKGAFLEVRYRDARLVEVVPHQPVVA